jgi:hypothetical protein
MITAYRGVTVARTFTCSTCQRTLPAGAKGPLPQRCGTCKERDRQKRKAARRMQQTEGPVLALVRAADDVLDGFDEPAEPQGAPEQPRRLADIARQELAEFASAHPAAETLCATVVLVAEVLDSPPVRVGDPRALPGLVKTLLDTLTVLVGDEADEDDGLFGDLPPPMVHTAAG